MARRTSPIGCRPVRRTRGDATRERLLEAAVELLEEGGYAAASVAAIAARSGVAAGALYRHFPSKAELFVEVFRADRGARAGRPPRGELAGPGTVVEKLDAIVREFTAQLPRPAAAGLGARLRAGRPAGRRRATRLPADLPPSAWPTCCGSASPTASCPSRTAELTAAALIGAISEALASPLSPVRDDERLSREDRRLRCPPSAAARSARAQRRATASDIDRTRMWSMSDAQAQGVARPDALGGRRRRGPGRRRRAAGRARRRGWRSPTPISTPSGERAPMTSALRTLTLP